MCGIAGIIGYDPNVVRTALASMVAVQVHRGPDDEGHELIELGNAWLGLGQRRLAIIDLSPAGHQPMTHAGTGDQIVFNGELYNFLVLRRELESLGAQFRGHSDTEVLLHALVQWGPDCIKRLEGMYAFAFCRRDSGRLLLARDPLGIKPLYYTALPEHFLFASEVRAILASGLVPDEVSAEAVAGFLAYGSVPEPLTIVENVHAFPAGCWQWFDVRQAGQEEQHEARRHWQFPPVAEDPHGAEVPHHLTEILDVAVRDHLVSDVPIGVFLSGGLDSTIVAGLAVHHTPQLRTFTVGFSDQPDLSEAHLAAETARRLGTVHTEIQITGSEAEGAACRWLDSLDQPSIDGLNTYVISRAVREQGIVVALSGLGGDELFGGYSSFARVPRLMKMLGRTGWIPPWIRAALTGVAAVGRPAAVRQKAVDIARTDGSILDLFLQCRRAMSDTQLASLGVHPRILGLTGAFLSPDVVHGLEPTTDDVVAALSQLESRFYMGNTLLRDSDTNGMAHSLEIRVPMLDRRMLDFAFGLPGAVRLPTGTNNKHLLRQAFPDLLRPELTDRRKTGFTLPIGHWIAGPLRDMCESALAYLKQSGMLSPVGVDAVWNRYIRAADRTRWSRPFALCVLGHYLQKH